MTWKEFKQAMELRGLRDEDEITFAGDFDGYAILYKAGLLKMHPFVDDLERFVNMANAHEANKLKITIPFPSGENSE